LLPVPRVPTAQHPELPTGVLADDERPSPHTPGDEI
jgi:hypothetical protein